MKNERIIKAIKVLTKFESVESKKYWLNVLVIGGDITRAEAGQITNYLNL